MRRLTIDDLKRRKNYSTNTYRLRLTILYYSLCLIGIEILILGYLYFSMPEPLYFATNSASAIKPLVALREANEGDEALLAPDIPEEMGSKRLTVD